MLQLKFGDLFSSLMMSWQPIACDTVFILQHLHCCVYKDSVYFRSFWHLCWLNTLLCVVDAVKCLLKIRQTRVNFLMPFRHQTELFLIFVDSANHHCKVPSFDVDSKVPLAAVPALSGWLFLSCDAPCISCSWCMFVLFWLERSHLCKVKFNVGSNVKQNSNRHKSFKGPISLRSPKKLICGNVESAIYLSS